MTDRDFTIDLDEARRRTKQSLASGDLWLIAKTIERMLQDQFVEPMAVTNIQIEQKAMKREMEVQITIVAPFDDVPVAMDEHFRRGGGF